MRQSMRQRVIPILASVTQRRKQDNGCHRANARGLAVLHPSHLSKSTGFTPEERGSAQPGGFLPPAIHTFASHVNRENHQWKNSAPGNGRRLLHKDRSKICTSDQDLKGTGAIVNGTVGLAGVVRQLKSDIRIGATSAGGSSTEPIVRKIVAHTERPIIFALQDAMGRAPEFRRMQAA